MNAIINAVRITLLTAACSGAISLKAQDRLFTYTYQSTVLNKGQSELESWNTFRSGKQDYYARYDNSTEYEIGLGKNLQTSFYLNFTSETNTMSENSEKYLSTTNEIGFANEWKLKLLDPVAHPIGLALYGEFGIMSNEYDLEGKIILDKKIGNLTIAANGSFEQEFEPGFENNEPAWEKERKFDSYLALAYSFSPKFHLTVENALKNVYTGGELRNSALFSGIGFSSIHDNFWINFTAMPQIAAFKNKTTKNLDLDEFEKTQFRLLFSVMF